MKINALLMHEADNVATTVVDIPAGTEVCFRKNNEFITLTAAEDIPYCHKIALCDLPEDTRIIKYGEIIGRSVRFIGKGCWVYHENIESIPRDYDSEMLPL